MADRTRKLSNINFKPSVDFVAQELNLSLDDRVHLELKLPEDILVGFKAFETLVKREALVESLSYVNFPSGTVVKTFGGSFGEIRAE